MRPGPARNDWWTAFTRRPGARLVLICFPYAGGSPSLFNTWASQLPEQVDLYAIRLPGHGERSAETPIADLTKLVPALSAALLTILHRPFLFFGHSLGALLSFEVARWLRRHCRIVPAGLLVSGRRAPHIPDADPRVSELCDSDFLARLRELKGTPPEVLEHAEFFRVFAPRLRADFKLVETYNYVLEPPLPCPITAVGGVDDEESSGDRLDAWNIHTSGTFVKYVLPGDHFFLHSGELELLRLVRGDLIQTMAKLPHTEGGK